MAADEVKLSRETLRELISGIGDVVGGGRGSSRFGGGDSGSFDTSGGGSFRRASTDAFRQFSEGTKGMLGDVDDVMTGWQASVNAFGGSFNNDVVGLTTSVKGTRLSLRQWGDLIDDNKQGLASFGGTMTESLRLFNNLSTEFSESSTTSGLREMGMSIADYNKLLLITMKSNKNLNLMDKEGKRELFEATAKLGKEMDVVSKLTGMSKQEMMSKMQQDAVDPRYQARRRLQQQRGFGAGVAAMDRVQTVSGIAGIEDLSKNVFEGGAITERSAAQLTAMGGELGNQVRSIITELRETSDPAKAAALAERYEKLVPKIATALNSERNLTTASVGSGTYQEILAETSLKAATTAESIAKLQKNEGLTEEQAIERLLTQAKNEQKGLDAQGSKVLGSEVTKNTIALDRLADTLEAAKAPVIQAAAAKSGEILSNANTAEQINAMDKKAQEKLGSLANEASNDIRQGNLKNIFGTGAKLFNTGTELFGDGVKIFKDVIVETFAPGISQVTQPEQITTKTAEAQPKKPGMAHGSAELFSGDWFGGDFGKGMDVILHGNEAVIPKARLSEFLADMKIPQQIPVPIPTQQEDRYQQRIGNDDSVILKDINNQLITLNTVMITLVKNTDDLVHTGHKEYSAIKKLSPNLNAR